MKVRELIEWMNKTYDLDDAIVVAWWDQTSFSAAHDLTPKQWLGVTEYMEAGDWWQTKEALDYALLEYLEEDAA